MAYPEARQPEEGSSRLVAERNAHTKRFWERLYNVVDMLQWKDRLGEIISGGESLEPYELEAPLAVEMEDKAHRHMDKHLFPERYLSSKLMLAWNRTSIEDEDVRAYAQHLIHPNPEALLPVRIEHAFLQRIARLIEHFALAYENDIEMPIPSASTLLEQPEKLTSFLGQERSQRTLAAFCAAQYVPSSRFEQQRKVHHLYTVFKKNIATLQRVVDTDPTVTKTLLPGFGEGMVVRQGQQARLVLGAYALILYMLPSQEVQVAHKPLLPSTKQIPIPVLTQDNSFGPHQVLASGQAYAISFDKEDNFERIGEILINMHIEKVENLRALCVVSKADGIPSPTDYESTLSEFVTNFEDFATEQVRFHTTVKDPYGELRVDLDREDTVSLHHRNKPSVSLMSLNASAYPLQE